MPLYGVLTDIHGDLESLAAVEEHMHKEGVQHIACLGDMIDRGEFPEEIVAWVRTQANIIIRGNHEEMKFYPESSTMEKLSEESIAWLSDLPTHAVKDNLRFVHGCPPSSDWTYVNAQSDEYLHQAMEIIPETRSFVGHTHRPHLYRLTPKKTIERSKLEAKPVTLDDESRYIINVGPVYRQRMYALFNPENQQLQMVNA